MSRGLDWAKELYENGGQRARELRDGGKKVIGYICVYPPVELITGAGLVPYRITGSLKPITEADLYLETLMCTFIRSCFDLGLEKQCSFLDGVFWPHSCDNIHKTYDVWKHYIPHSFFYYIDFSHMTDDYSLSSIGGLKTRDPGLLGDGRLGNNTLS